MLPLFARLAEGLTAGVTVVTPNRRLAQELTREFDHGILRLRPADCNADEVEGARIRRGASRSYSAKCREDAPHRGRIVDHEPDQA